MDLFNKKSRRTMALMLNWPTLLTAMEVWDLSHHVPASGQSWSHLAGPRNPALHQHHSPLLEEEHTTITPLFDTPGSPTASPSNIPAFTGHIGPIDRIHTGGYGKDSFLSFDSPGQQPPGGFIARDGLVDDWWGGHDSPEQRSIHQRIGEDPQHHPFLSTSRTASPWRGTRLPDSPPLDTRMEKLDEWSWLEDLFESGDWNAVKAPKSSSVPDHWVETPKMLGKVSPENEYTPHRDFFQDVVFEELPDLVSLPALDEYNHHPLSDAHLSPSPVEPYNAITSTGSPRGDAEEDSNPMTHMKSHFPPFFPVRSRGEALRDEDFQPDSLYESIAGIGIDSQAHKATEALSHHDHTWNAPSTELLQSSSDHRVLDESQLRYLESHVGHAYEQGHNFDPSLESQHFHGERGPISLDISSQLHPLLVDSLVPHELANYEKSFDHLTPDTSHNSKLTSPISETKKGSERSSESSQDSPITIDSLLHELDSLPHLDDLPDLKGFSIDPHMLFSPLFGQHGILSETTPSSFLDTQAPSIFKDASDIDKPDDDASPRLTERENNKVELNRLNSDQQNLNQDITTLHGTNLPSRNALESPPKPGQLKRPIQTYHIDSRPPKRRTSHDSSSFDEDDGSISPAKLISTSTGSRIHPTDSSIPSGSQPSRSPSKPHHNLGHDSERHSDFQEARNEDTLPEIFDKMHSKINAIKEHYSRTWADEKLNEATLEYSERVRRMQTALGMAGTSSQDVSLDIARPLPLSTRALIDIYQPRIQEFMDSILEHEPIVHQSKHLISNLRLLWDNYLEMIAICSEIISLNRVPTDMERDLLDAHNWISEKWTRIPETKFNWWPTRGAVYPPGKPEESNAFSKKFNSLPVHEGTVFWLNHRLYNKRREGAAAEYVLRFIHEKREDWIRYLTPRTVDALLSRTLLNTMKKIRSLRYPTPSRHYRAWDARVQQQRGL